MALSDQEIKVLLEKAKSYRKIGEQNQDVDLTYLEQELNCYNEIIENATPYPHYFRRRADIRYCISVRLDRHDLLNSAMEDINKAIELDPDKGGYYLDRGLYLWVTIEKTNISDSKKKRRLFENVIADYKTCINRDPTNPRVWLDLIALNMILYKWDEAISFYGSCKPYIKDKNDLLSLSWLGCLALIFAGDSLEEEDKKPLYDQTIRRSLLINLDFRISSFIGEIREEKNCKEEWGKVKEINELFIAHIDELKGKGDILANLKCYEEAIKAYEEAIELDPDNALIWNNKGVTLQDLNRYEEALEAYDKAIELKPDFALAKGNKDRILVHKFTNRIKKTVGLRKKLWAFWRR